MMVTIARDEARGYAVKDAGSPPGPASPWTAPSWDEVVRTHSARVYRLAYRLTGNPHDAEDLTQEVFVRVFRSLSTYTPGTFEGWLHRITTNLFLDSGAGGSGSGSRASARKSRGGCRVVTDARPGVRRPPSGR